MSSIHFNPMPGTLLYSWHILDVDWWQWVRAQAFPCLRFNMFQPYQPLVICGAFFDATGPQMASKNSDFESRHATSPGSIQNSSGTAVCFWINAVYLNVVLKMAKSKVCSCVVSSSTRTWQDRTQILLWNEVSECANFLIWSVAQDAVHRLMAPC